MGLPWGKGMYMYKAYWARMARYGIPKRSGLVEEWNEMLAEPFLSLTWIMELLDVTHTLLRMVHPWMGALVYPIVRKHALREMGVTNHRR